MKLNKKDAISMCAFLIDKVQNLNELKTQIEVLKIKDSLGSDGIMKVVDIYQQYRLSKFSDIKLIEELLFWADGGNYKTHMDGFNATSPKSLINECKKRKWNVLEFKEKILVSSSEFPLITLSSVLLIG